MASAPDRPRRIVVVGTSGSGKTTFARDLARRKGVPHVEIDALHWGPRWTPAPRPALRARLAEAVATDAWVVDGNYGAVRDVVWPRAEAVVWLDYPLPLVLARLVRRTLRRIRDREVRWAGNTETLEEMLSPEKSVVAWTMRTYGKHHHGYPRLFRERRYRHLAVIRLRSPREAEEWLARS
jgi:adenylate kinase family enzyme